MYDSIYRYCPYCATSLAQRERFGQVRPVCPTCGFVYFQDPKVAVIGFVVWDGKLLLIRRAVDPAKGKWALPGGYMDAGEMPDRALKREMREEVGLDITIERLLDIYPMAGPGVNARGIVLAYAAMPTNYADGGVLEAHDDVSEAGWFAPEEIPGDLAFESTRALLAEWRRRRESESDYSGGLR